MRKALVVGGANGIGLAIATVLARMDSVESVVIIDKVEPEKTNMNPKFMFHLFDLTSQDYSIFDQFRDIDTLMITAGFGRLSLFKDIPEDMIQTSFNVNTIPAMRIIHRYYDKLESQEDFYCGVMVSISGYMSSPFFSVYAATKAALRIFIESVNVELEKAGSANRILNVSPGSLKGTSFEQKKTDLTVIEPLAAMVVKELSSKNDLFIPDYDTVFKQVLERSHEDFRKEGSHSYDYKLERINRNK